MQNNIKLYFRGRGGRKILPITGQGGQTDFNTTRNRNVIGLDKTLGKPRKIEVANCLTAREDRGLSNRIAEGTMIAEMKIAIPVSSPDYQTKNQNGRRLKEDGDPMFTLTAQDRHGVAIRETDDGFHLCRNDAKKSSIQGTHVTYPDGASHCLTSAHTPMTIDQLYIDGISDEYSFAKKKAQEILDKNGALPERFNPYNSSEITDEAPTLTANCDRSASSSTVLMKQPGFRIRKLTTLECWRLQGFQDWAFYRAREAGVSDSQLYKQAGNSVTVNVTEVIGRAIVE